jgi:hypothetical protein
MSDQSPWDAFRTQDPRQGQGQPQYPPPQPAYRQPQDPGRYQDQPPYPPQQPQPSLTRGPQYAPPSGDPRYLGQPQQPYQQGQSPYGQQPPPAGAPRGHRSGQSWQSWPLRRKVLTIIGGVFGFFVLIAAISAAAHGGTATKTVTEPGPTVTVTQAAPTVTVTRPAPAVTKTVTVKVTPTANAQGEATQISADGVYVVGQDIPGGTWHTSGGSQCYEATLSSTNTSDIIDNNNFTGPDTVSLAGAAAFQISGGCTWQQEG